jgi:dTMP kinase
VCERFHASTFAYQAVAGELEEEELLRMLETWAGDPAPDRTVILELDVERAARRRGGEEDRIEAKGLEFQRKVAEGYRRFAARAPRVGVVSAGGSIEEVAARVREEVARADH